MRRENCFFNCLDLIVERLNFISTPLIQVLIQERHVFLFKHLGTVLGVFLKEARDASWVDDLVAWAQGQVQERGYRDAGHEKGLRECVADVVNVFYGVCRGIECFFRSYDPNVASVVYNLTNEGNILKTKNGQLFVFDHLVAKNVTCLPIERALPKDRANDCTLL